MDWDDFVAEFTETASDGYVAARDIVGNLSPREEAYDRAEAFLACCREFEDYLKSEGYEFVDCA